MSDLLEQDLRDTLAQQAARIDPHARARLCAIDYRPRRRRRPPLPALGALGVSGSAAAVVAVVALGSGAAPAFAGWSATPTSPLPGQLATAESQCGAAGGAPIITDTRGPYTASVYADGRTCLQGAGESLQSSRSGGDLSAVPAGQVQLTGAGLADSSGQALTMVDGRTGAGVQGVVVHRSDGTSVTATVSDGWYLAWWPGAVRATSADVTSAGGTETQAFPVEPGASTPTCPAGSHCSSGYGFGSAPGSGSSVQQAGTVRSGFATGKR